MSARSIVRSIVTIFLLSLVPSSCPNAAQRQGPRPIPDPAQGDGGVSAFYNWDKKVPATPGELLRQELLPEHLQLENASNGFRILYTSTDGVEGKTPITASGAVFIPNGAAPAGGWPIIAWAHGTTGVADVCAPSWAPRSKRDTDYLNAWLVQGYAVVAADYQGLGTPGGHPWMSMRPEGWSVLDSVRAALGAFPQLANAVVIVGQSQGGHAALSAALLAKTYAPAINIKGTVATGVPSPQSFARLARQGSGTVLLLMLYRSMAIDQAFRPSEYLTEAGQLLFEAAGRTCPQPGAPPVGVETLFKRTPEVLIASLAAPYPTLRFDHPVLIGAGLDDKSILAEEQYGIAVDACRSGSTIETHYYAGKDHGGTVNASLVHSVPFVKKTLAGEPVTGNCDSIGPPTRN
jgi:pimeloyl-ACP methyl ester carboxylesterase